MDFARKLKRRKFPFGKFLPLFVIFYFFTYWESDFNSLVYPTRKLLPAQKQTSEYEKGDISRINCLNKCKDNSSSTADPSSSRNFGTIGTYAEETSRFKCYLKCNESFAFVRWNDGELDTLTGSNSKTRARMLKIEGWSMEKGTKNYEKLRADLLISLQVRSVNFLYGFNFPSCSEGLVIQQLSGGGSWKWVSRFSRLDVFPPVAQLTYADLLSGRNYHYFGMKELIRTVAQKSNTIIFANELLKRKKKISWQRQIVGFDSDLTGKWLQMRETVLDKALSLAKSHNSYTFLVSLGPISNILISSMWNVNRNNTYIDVGSALNEFHGVGVQGRAYLRNPACQALGPTCTATKYRVNRNVSSDKDITIRSVSSMDKIRCCTPVLNNCDLKLERWYAPIGKASRKVSPCRGLLPKHFIVHQIIKLCKCGKLESEGEIHSCLSA